MYEPSGVGDPLGHRIAAQTTSVGAVFVVVDRSRLDTGRRRLSIDRKDRRLDLKTDQHAPTGLGPRTDLKWTDSYGTTPLGVGGRGWRLLK